jgi:hypothetical protein
MQKYHMRQKTGIRTKLSLSGKFAFIKQAAMKLKKFSEKDGMLR